MAGPQRAFTAAFRPVIGHLNNAANRLVRRLGLEPADELASARTPRSWSRWPGTPRKEGALEPDTADLFVRTLDLADLTAENVMTPRVQVTALEERATAEDVANATRATGLSRFPVYRDSLDDVVGIVHIKDVLAVPAERRPRAAGRRAAARAAARARDADRGPAAGPAAPAAADGGRHRRVRRHGRGGHPGGHRRGGGRRGPRRARPAGDCPTCSRAARTPHGPPVYDADGAARTDDRWRGSACAAPDGPYETLAGLVAERLGRIPETGDTVELAGWRIEVTDAAGRRAARARLARRRTPRTAGGVSAVRARGTRRDGRAGRAR